MKVYLFNEETKEFCGFEQAFKDPLESSLIGRETYILPPNGTLVEPRFSYGMANIWNGNIWEQVEDNRGKEYWLDTDEYGTPARIMKELGKFPHNAVFEAPVQTIEQLKTIKVFAMKVERDRIQELPIEYNGKSFDYNKESLQKLNEAKDCLEGTEDIQIWICADNSLTYLNYNDIMAIKRLGKERSNNVHIQYAKLKYLIEMAKTAEEVEEITFETDTSTIPLEV